MAKEGRSTPDKAEYHLDGGILRSVRGREGEG